MTDAKPIDVEVESKALTPRQPMPVGQALGVSEILAQVRLIQEVMSKVMVENEHFGVIPGCGTKKTLLQPGAQKLTMTFRLAPKYEIQETDIANGHKGYRVVCTLKSITSGTFVGQGVGCCSTMESKYRWRQGARKCPKCGKESIIKGKAEFGGGWLCWAKKDGCGAKWGDGAAEIESQSVEKVENPDPADCYNTVLKIAKKRAFVDATITATAASDIFTQDIGDAETDENPPTPAKASPKPPPNAQKPPAKVSQPSAGGPDTPGFAERCKAKFLERIGKAMMEPYAWLWGVEAGLIMDNEVLADAQADKFPTTTAEFEAATLQMEAIRKRWSDEQKDAYEKVVLNHERFLAEQAEKAKKATKTETGFVIKPKPEQEPWRNFPVPFGGSAGVLLGNLDKKKLWGWWANFKVETEYNGKPKAPGTIARDQQFRAMLDAAGAHYEFEPPEDATDKSNREADKFGADSDGESMPF